ncbi:MAG: hypothetical protein AUI10_08215 [Actinobacteria bacterium 13_2_20CM_2_72_6]|nr:MAG: hypothetical protein AUI10_08215 [Actinobacteria bacterium 13_2_20CM_2_72_6]
MTTPTGEIIRTGQGAALRFEREYAFPPDEVWSALTTPERAGRWLGELSVTGDTARLVLGDTPDEIAELRVVACDRPYRIEVLWTFPGAAPTHLLVTLAPAAADRTALVLVHTFPALEPAHLPGYGCGWQHYLDALGAHLAGAPLPDWADYYPALLEPWRALVPSGG